MTENEKRAGYLKEHHRLLHDTTTAHLPFALSRIEIFDFQGIKHLVISNIPTNAQWIFLTGENGFGKTSILRAIAKGLVGDENFVEPLPKESRIYVNGYNWNRPFFYSASPKKTADNDFQMATYGVARFRYHSDPEDVNPKTALLFSDKWQLFNIEKILIEAERAKLEQKEKKTLTKFETILLGLQAILFRHELHEFSRRNCLKFVKIRVIRV